MSAAVTATTVVAMIAATGYFAADAAWLRTKDWRWDDRARVCRWLSIFAALLAVAVFLAERAS